MVKNDLKAQGRTGKLFKEGTAERDAEDVLDSLVEMLLSDASKLIRQAVAKSKE